jgi:hypothetical protein
MALANSGGSGPGLVRYRRRSRAGHEVRRRVLTHKRHRISAPLIVLPNASKTRRVLWRTAHKARPFGIATHGSRRRDGKWWFRFGSLLDGSSSPLIGSEGFTRPRSRRRAVW